LQPGLACFAIIYAPANLTFGQSQFVFDIATDLACNGSYSFK